MVETRRGLRALSSRTLDLGMLREAEAQLFGVFELESGREGLRRTDPVNNTTLHQLWRPTGRTSTTIFLSFPGD